MKIKISYLYHIKDEYFDVADDDNLIQNAFPTLEKYIDHVHTVDGKPAKVSEKLSEIILYNFKNLMKLKNKGINLFFTDIDSLKKKMLNEIKIIF